MKCSVCGGDYGNGNFCQNCGTDRVSALGNYSGYSSVNINQSNPMNGNDHPTEGNICWHCGEVIPLGSKFCPFCSTPLIVECPKCGHTYSSRYPACSNCGTNREEYYNEQKRNAEEKSRREKFERAERKKELAIEEEWMAEYNSYKVDAAYEVLKKIAYKSDGFFSSYRHKDRYFKFLQEYISSYQGENRVLRYVLDNKLFFHPDDTPNMKRELDKIVGKFMSGSNQI